MRKTDEIIKPKSCFNMAASTEWVFILLGRDKSAPVAIRAWIADRIKRGKNTEKDQQILEAEACAMQMEATGDQFRNGKPE